ncbi:MAG TPA: hypothetical protein VHK70_08325 [Burkholderiaceae bacterium]|nr:hypothetical protein [Burkholderiaceae bacterium]
MLAQDGARFSVVPCAVACGAEIKSKNRAVVTGIAGCQPQPGVKSGQLKETEHLLRSAQNELIQPEKLAILDQMAAVDYGRIE